MVRGDQISVLEAAYRLGEPEPEWLRSVASALSPCLDRGSSLVAYGYDLSDPERPRIDPVIDHGMPPGWTDAALPAHLEMPHEQRLIMYRSGPCTTTRTVFGKLRARYVVSERMRAAFGLQDFLVLTAANPNDQGCAVLVPASDRIEISEREVRAWSRVAAHIAAGRRLRAAIANDVAVLTERGDAVLAPDGELKHASGSARDTAARDALRRAVRAVDRARSELRSRDADEALELWQGLVSGQWTLVDHFDSDGRRFVVAVRNVPETRASRGLSDLERCVLGYVALGHSYKLVAYELGISVSTVSAAVSGICKKLGVAGRVELASLLGQKLAG